MRFGVESAPAACEMVHSEVELRGETRLEVAVEGSEGEGVAMEGVEGIEEREVGREGREGEGREGEEELGA